MLAEAARRMLLRRHLDPWIAAATRGLAEESRDRLREEIEDHFHEALDAGLDQGLSPDRAARTAVEALGSAREARRQFRRTYLTSTETRLVRSFTRKPRPGASSWETWGARRSRIFAGTFATLVAALNAFLDSAPAQGSAGAWILVALMCCGMAGLAATPRIFRAGNQRAAVVLGAVSETAIWGGYLLSFVDAASTPGALGMALLLGASIYRIVCVVPKLEKKSAPK